MSQRLSRTPDRSLSKEDKAMQKNVFARRHLDADLEAQQGLEKMHLQTIRNEKMRLQKELERMRGRGQRVMGRRPVAGMSSSNTARLTQLRLNREPVLNGAAAGGPGPGAAVDPGKARVPPEAVGGRPGRQTIELPAINPGNRSSRNGYRSTSGNRYEMGEDYAREQQMLEHRKILSKKQEQLLARVEKFGEDLGGQRQPRAGSGEEPATRSPTERSVKSDEAVSSTWDPSSSFPPPGRTNYGDVAKRGRSNSLTEYDLGNIKQSINKRLVGEERAGQCQGQGSDAGSAPEKQQLGRTISTTTKPRRKNQSTGSEPRPPMDMVFDQETYAPDGSLRTIHTLPDPNESFEEAKKARYLRWRGPQEGDVELSVDEIFGKSDGMISRKESSVAPPTEQAGP